MHVEVGQIHLGDRVITAMESLNGVQPLHLVLLVPDVSIGLGEIDACPHLVSTQGTLPHNGEEGGPEAIGGLRW